MTILEQLVATDHPAWTEMIAARSAREVGGGAPGVSTPLRMGGWGRKGGSHFKDGQFSKK